MGLHLIGAHANLSAHLSIHVSNLVNRFLKKIIKLTFRFLRGTFVFMHVHQCFLTETVPVTKEQEAKNRALKGWRSYFTAI